MRRCWSIPATCVALGLLFAGSLRAEDIFGVYGGTAQTMQSDVRAIVPLTNSDLTFRNIDWATNASEQPYYFGLRYTHYFNEWPAFGISLDLTHNKMFSNLAGATAVSGYRNGVPVSSVERLSSSFQELQMSHGLNTVTIGPMYRVNLCDDDSSDFGRVWPYFGLGIGVARPHVEVQMVGLPGADDYRWGGLAYQAQAGVNVRITECFSIFAEFKAVCVPNLDVDISGGTLRTKALSYHFLFGPAFTW